MNYPLAYYTAYFSIRAKAFNYETMCRGRDKLEFYMKEITSKPKDERSGSEEDSLREMRMAQEMYARGFEFWPLDIYRADDVNCLIIDGKIMPPFDSVEGVAGKAASQIKEAVKELRKDDPEAKFISKEDLRLRSGIGKSTIEKMSALGILDGMPESSQLSIFDF